MKNKTTLILLPFLVLALASLACTLVSSREEPLPPDILFQDDFSDPSSGWDQTETVDGSIGYVDGQYRIFVDVPNTDIWGNPGLDFTDTVIEVEATKVGGSDDNDLGIICRYQDISNFYFMIISNDGFYAIGKTVNGFQELIGLENMEFSEHIKTGDTTNQMRADCIGSTLRLFVNGYELLTTTDDTFSSGDVGLLAGTFEIPGTDIRFDNFVVRAP